MTFALLKNRIWPAIREVAITIEHVGSTSVPWLAAKPVIDIDIVVASRTRLPSLISRLEPLGYRHCGDLGIDDREAFAATENLPDHNLYACVQGSVALRNHLAVRDYLRAHPAEAEKYSSLKKRLAKKYFNDIDGYIEGKTSFILSILGRRGFSDEELELIRYANRR